MFDGWRRSTRCSESGCVEVWQRPDSCTDISSCVEVASSFCESNQCVTVGTYPDETLTTASGERLTRAVRDSKLGPESPVLRFTEAEWQAFIAGVKAGEFD